MLTVFLLGKHESESYRTGRLLKEQTWSSFATSHYSKTNEISWNDRWFEQCWFRSLKCPILASRSFIVCVWGQRSSNQDDFQRKKSHNETCFPGPTELRLIGNSIESIWTQKIQIKYIDTKNHFADMLTKGNFTRDESNHLLCLFNISLFSSTVCSEGLTKRTQQDSGEEKVTAKSRPMMSLIARAPSTLSSSASESPGNKSYWSQNPWSAKAEKDDTTRQPVVDRDSSHESMHHHKQFVESSYSTGNPLFAVTQVTSTTTTTDSLKARTQQATKNGTLIKLGLLKIGKLINRWMIERGNPLSPPGQGHTSSNQVSLIRRPNTLFWKKKKLMIERGNPLSALKEEQCHSNSSLETTKQNWICR